MKKFFALFLTVAMIATVFASVVVVNADNKLTITIGSVEAEAGADAVVEIKLTNNTGINSIKMSLNYGDLTFKKATFPIYDSDDEGMMRSSNNKADQKLVILNWISADNSVEGDATYAKVTFTVPEGAANGTVYALTATIDPEDVFVGTDTNVAFEVVDGQVKVPGEEVPADPAAFNSMSFNTVWVDGTQICDVGDALGYLKQNPIDGDVQSIGVRGWARIDNSAIDQFGYKLDGGEPVFSAAYTQDRSDVWAAFGVTAEAANGFNINPVDVSALATGDHTITVVVKAADGNVVEVVTAPFAITRPAPAYSLLNVSYDTLIYDDTTFVDGSADKWIHNLEDPSVLDFEVGTVQNITVRGWVRISEDAADIAGFGYSIDGGAVVTNASFIQERSAELSGAGFPGAQGFAIVVPVADLEAGEHSIDAYVIAVDGTEIKIVKDRSTADIKDIRQVGVTFNVTEVPVDPAALQNYSFNTVWVDGAQICDTGDALGYLKQNPIDGDVQSIGVRGWAQLANSGIDQFGYAIDDGEPVFSAAYTQERSDVWAAIGSTAEFANGFNINPVDVSALETGDHTITVVVKAADGNVVEVVTAPFSITRPVEVEPLAITVSDAEVEEGETFEITVDLSNVEALASLKLTISWPEELELQNAEYSFDTEGAQIHTADDWTAVTGSYSFNWMVFDEEEQLTEDVTFLTLTFKATAAGEYTVEADVEDDDNVFCIIDEEPVNVDYEIEDGVVIVKAVSAYNLINVSYDGLYYDGALKLKEGGVDKQIILPENRPELDYNKGDVSTITIRGWVRLTENTADIKGFGYAIDGGEVVIGLFVEDRPDLATAGFPGGVGFNVAVPVADLEAGEHSIDVYVIAADDSQIKVVKTRDGVDNQVGVTFTVSEEDEAEEPEIINTCVDEEKVEDDKLSVAGWTGSNYKVLKIGYTVDGGEPIYEDIVITEVAEGDPVLNPENAGENGFRYAANIDFSGLSAGEHEIAIVIMVDDEDNTVLEIRDPFTVTVEGTANPQTADIAVVAIAAVATIALAGAVVGKKALKK